MINLARGYEQAGMHHQARDIYQKLLGLRRTIPACWPWQGTSMPFPAMHRRIARSRLSWRACAANVTSLRSTSPSYGRAWAIAVEPSNGWIKPTMKIAKSLVYLSTEPTADPLRSDAVWLLLGLEFALAADIVRTAISPTWVDIGQLGAIAVIRTFLNFFLERDLDSYDSKEAETAKTKTMPVAA
jgi:uncharacterized membrane protein